MTSAARPANPVTETDTTEATLVALSGDLDMRVADLLRQRLFQALANARHALVFDLTATTFCSASTLRVLLETTAAARAAGLPWAVVSDRRVVLRVIRAAGLDTALRPLPNLAAARVSLAAQRREAGCRGAP